MGEYFQHSQSSKTFQGPPSHVFKLGPSPKKFLVNTKLYSIVECHQSSVLIGNMPLVLVKSDEGSPISYCVKLVKLEEIPFHSYFSTCSNLQDQWSTIYIYIPYT